MSKRSYSPEFKLQVVLEALQSNGTDAEVARAYDIHPVSLSNWKRKLKQNGAKAFGGDNDLKKKDDKIANLERMIGKKEVEIALPKSTYGDVSSPAYRQKRPDGPSEDDQKLMHCIRKIIQEHPGYGYRRLLPEAGARLEERINHKRLRRVLNEYELALPRQLPATRPSTVQKILTEATGHLNLVAAIEPARWGSSRPISPRYPTEVPYAKGSRKVHLMAVVDVESRYVLGWALGASANRTLALRCWQRVRERINQLGFPWRSRSCITIRTSSTRATAGSERCSWGRAPNLLRMRRVGKSLHRVALGLTQGRGRLATD